MKIDFLADSSKYAGEIAEGSEVIGVIEHEGIEGALVCITGFGSYRQYVSAKESKSLPQLQVKKLLASDAAVRVSLAAQKVREGIRPARVYRKVKSYPILWTGESLRYLKEEFHRSEEFMLQVVTAFRNDNFRFRLEDVQNTNGLNAETEAFIRQEVAFILHKHGFGSAEFDQKKLGYALSNFKTVWQDLAFTLSTSLNDVTYEEGQLVSDHLELMRGAEEWRVKVTYGEKILEGTIVGLAEAESLSSSLGAARSASTSPGTVKYLSTLGNVRLNKTKTESDGSYRISNELSLVFQKHEQFFVED